MRGFETYLENAASDHELFLGDEYGEVFLDSIVSTCVVEYKDSAVADARISSADVKRYRSPDADLGENCYYYKFWYDPLRAFFEDARFHEHPTRRLAAETGELSRLSSTALDYCAAHQIQLERDRSKMLRFCQRARANGSPASA